MKPLKKYVILLIVTIGFSSCGSNSSSTIQIAIGPYIIDFPSSYYLEPRQGTDSQVGIITNDSIEIHFDFGNYTNELPLPFDEYYEKGGWQFNLPHLFMKSGITYDSRNMPAVEILEVITYANKDSGMRISENQMLVYCRHEDEFREQIVNIPAETMNHDFMIDTIDNHYRKIVIAKDPLVGTTGLYLKEVSAENNPMWGIALGLSTSGLSKSEQEELVAIFKTARLHEDHH